MMAFMLHTETQRTVPCCSYCGELVEADADACEDHPTEALTTVTIDSSWLAPAHVATATTLTTAQIDTVRAWLDSVTARGGTLSTQERNLLAACAAAAKVDPNWCGERPVPSVHQGARATVAAAFNTLQRGA